jgi:hypothetical protein
LVSRIGQLLRALGEPHPEAVRLAPGGADPEVTRDAHSLRGAVVAHPEQDHDVGALAGGLVRVPVALRVSGIGEPGAAVGPDEQVGRT